MFFRKSRRKDIEHPASQEFIGRHQQLYSVKKFLGQDIPDLELQIARNKDNDERKEIVEKLEDIDGYIKSDLFTHRFAVQSVFDDIHELTDKGYENCVLKNDNALENRCLKILDDTTKYMQDYWRNNNESDGETMSEQLESLSALTTMRGTVSYLTLGGLLNDDEQIVWAIMNSVFHSNKLVREASSLLPPEPSQQQAQKIKKMGERLLAEKKINANNLRKIEEEIKEGLLLNQEYYKDNVSAHTTHGYVEQGGHLPK
jgi:hypothetical protein